MAERGGHGRDGPVIPKEPTAASAGGGGGASKAGGGSERERTSGYKVGEEELSLEVPGRYERMRVLGRGSFGAVTLVKDNRDSKLYAMKTLNCADKPEERVTAMAEVSTVTINCGAFACLAAASRSNVWQFAGGVTILVPRRIGR